VKDLLLDTNVVSILFKPDHPLYDKCLGIAGGSQWFISFMTRAELLLWPRLNHWGATRREKLVAHMGLCTTLLPDEATCDLWTEIMAESQTAGTPMTVADAWVAAAAKQWRLALITADHRDFDHLNGLILIPISK
jgi:predicted nucleic acid-binding protein